MTPMEVMAEQVEPMLTLTTDDDINWMVVTSNPQPTALRPASLVTNEETEITKPTTGEIYNLYLYCITNKLK